jgi:hypothetical protein
MEAHRSRIKASVPEDLWRCAEVFLYSHGGKETQACKDIDVSKPSFCAETGIQISSSAFEMAREARPGENRSHPDNEPGARRAPENLSLGPKDWLKKNSLFPSDSSLKIRNRSTSYFPLPSYSHLFSTVDPRQVDGLEYSSTCLWQLKKDVETGNLAVKCMQWERMKPQIWCIVGNAFSQQRDHDAAINFFKRAIAIDPGFCYAYSLCGHE